MKCLVQFFYSLSKVEFDCKACPEGRVTGNCTRASKSKGLIFLFWGWCDMEAYEVSTGAHCYERRFNHFSCFRWTKHIQVNLNPWRRPQRRTAHVCTLGKQNNLSINKRHDTGTPRIKTLLSTYIWGRKLFPLTSTKLTHFGQRRQIWKRI